MSITNLILTNFKNYESSEFKFEDKFNSLVGNNGVGKTNVLDAIHYLCVGKSYFHNQDKHNIKYNQDFFRIEGYFHNENIINKVVAKFSVQTKKVIEFNNVAYTKLAEHLGKLPLVLICPDDIKLINEGSEERRRFVDFSISQLNNNYLNSLIDYNRILLQRNTLLKNFNSSFELLNVYNLQLAELGKYIYSQRVDFFNSFIDTFIRYYNFISNDKETVGLQYVTDLHNNDLLELLIQSEQQDIFLKRTTKGIHKDDFNCVLFGQQAKIAASQGQKKSFLLALKLAQCELIFNKTAKSPLLFLDDIFDKLDIGRVAQLLDMLNEKPFGQVIITDTDMERVKKVLKGCFIVL